MLAITACGEGRFNTHDAWSRPTPAGSTAVVYFLLQNDTSQDDALIGASTEVARVVEMHQNMSIEVTAAVGPEHEVDEHEEGATTGIDPDTAVMVPVEWVEISSGHEVLFEPGVMHLMLIDLQRELVEGDHFTLVLHFEHTVDLEVEVTVAEP